MCIVGNVSMQCILSQMPNHVPLASFIVPSVVGGLLLAIAVPLAFIYWRRLAGDLATYKQIWHKRRYLSAYFTCWLLMSPVRCYVSIAVQLQCLRLSTGALAQCLTACTDPTYVGFTTRCCTSPSYACWLHSLTELHHICQALHKATPAWEPLDSPGDSRVGRERRGSPWFYQVHLIIEVRAPLLCLFIR